MFFDFLSSYRFRRNVSAGLHCHCKIVTWTFLDLTATCSSLIVASCFHTSFRTTWISSTLVKMTIPLSSVHVYLLICSIKLPYFHCKKGGQLTSVSYLSVLSTLRSQITIRPIDVRRPVRTMFQSKQTKQNPYLLVLFSPWIFCSCLKLL